jgi:hypothetical protein
LGVLDRRRQEPVPYVLGVPRYMVGIAVRGILDSARRILRPEPTLTFDNELAVWDVLGFFYGKHLYRA